MSLAGVFTVKTASVDTAVAFIFTFTHVFTPTRRASLALVLYLAVYLCHCTHTHSLNAVMLDTRSFNAACIFYESAERALEASSFVKHVSESRTEKPPRLSSDVRWFDNSRRRRTAPGH